jgi:hypothetical protein
MFSHYSSFVAKFLEFFADEFSTLIVLQMLNFVCHLILRLGLVALECLKGCIFCTQEGEEDVSGCLIDKRHPILCMAWEGFCMDWTMEVCRDTMQEGGGARCRCGVDCTSLLSRDARGADGVRL